MMGAFSISLLTSCVDLDKAPLTEISEENLWIDPALVQAFVNSRYNQVGHGWTESMQSSVVDETELTWLRGCELTNFARITPSDLGRMNGAWWGWDNRAWDTKWKNISNCNIFFERIDEVPFADETLKDRLKGEVRFIRALEYNDLVTRWGGVPLITNSYTIDDDDEIKNQVRASYEDCVKFMVDELDAAAKELPATYSNSDYGRATSVAALALKSRILLYAASDLMNIGVKMPEVGYTSPNSERWENAAQAADDALKAAVENGYSLYNQLSDDPAANYQKIFLDNTSGNTEVIFARMGTASNLGENLTSLEQYNFSNGFGGWGGNCPLQELIDDYEVVKNGVASRFNWSDSEQAADPYANRDPRFYASILYDDASWKDRILETYWNVDASGEETGGGGRDSKYGIDSWNTSPTGYNMKKFMDESYVGNSWNFSAKNWIWLRMAELYLNKAEALYHTGNEEGAKDAVNEIRDRAQMPHITSSGEQLLEDIKHERRIELVFEEHRYFDVRRWKEGPKYLGRTVHAIAIKKYPDGHKTYEVTPLRSDIGGERLFNDKMYWLPILKSEIDKNPNLKQNPEYTN
jgi:hypothetical protein